jgi:hypothetical protein
MSVNLCRTSRNYSQEDCSLHSHRFKNLKFSTLKLSACPYLNERFHCIVSCWGRNVKAAVTHYEQFMKCNLTKMAYVIQNESENIGLKHTLRGYIANRFRLLTGSVRFANGRSLSLLTGTKLHKCKLI